DEGSFLKKEVVIVDNNSSDGSVEVIEKSIKSITHSASSGQASIRSILIESKENLGFSKAVNQGVLKASGKYVLLLNSDCKVKKGTLKKLFDFVENTKDVGVVGTKLLNPDGSTQKSCFNFPTIGKAVSQYWLGRKGLLDKFVPAGTVPAKSVEVDAVVGAAFLVTPKARKLVGLLDERYFMYFEDINYCRRVKRASLKVYYLPSAEVVHAHGASGKGIGDLQKKRLIESSKIYHGVFKHYLLNFIIWSGQKWKRMSR
ncbi:glycosyltransferase family 2 protein, partial [Patescibacteria group bacterium]|nr:glycosyltransferase family 2 protein [Patescibacteria group bacterium]